MTIVKMGYKPVLVIAAIIGAMLLGMALFGGDKQSVSADNHEPVLEDALWGDVLAPCEAVFGFDTNLRVTIPLHQRERELVHLAMDSFIADLQHEDDGVTGAVPSFWLRSTFLSFFYDQVVPSVQSRVGGAIANEWPIQVNEDAMLASVQNVELGGCERIAVSIAIEKWSVKSGGQMAAHLKLCDASQEMNATSACQSFRPLADAYKSLTKKIEMDQMDSVPGPPA